MAQEAMAPGRVSVETWQQPGRTELGRRLIVGLDKEDQVGFSVDSNTFLNMPAEARDATIKRALAAHRWNLEPPTPDELGM